MFFSTAWLPTPGFQVIALSLLIIKTFLIQMEASPPWSSLPRGSNSQHYLLWVRALSWALETHFSVPEYSANLPTSPSKRDPNPCRHILPPRGHQHPAPAAAAAPGASSAQAPLEAEWQHLFIHWHIPWEKMDFSGSQGVFELCPELQSIIHSAEKHRRNPRDSSMSETLKCP